MNDNGAGLAIAVSTYFDDVNRHGKKKAESPPSEDTKAEVKSNFGWLPHAPNIARDLKTAFNLWDAVRSKSLRLFCYDIDKVSGLCGIERGQQ